MGSALASCPTQGFSHSACCMDSAGASGEQDPACQPWLAMDMKLLGASISPPSRSQFHKPGWPGKSSGGRNTGLLLLCLPQLLAVDILQAFCLCLCLGEAYLPVCWLPAGAVSLGRQAAHEFLLASLGLCSGLSQPSPAMGWTWFLEFGCWRQKASRLGFS